MRFYLRIGRSLALSLAAALVVSAGAQAQSLTLPQRIEQCGTCHGEDGNSKLENIPSLAGQPSFFTLNQLILMREGVRKVEAMAPFVKGLTDAEIQALAEHYEKLPPKPSGETIDPALAERGAKVAVQRRCESCHLPSLAGQQQMPRLAKQRIDYMIHAMKQYLTDSRSGADTAMTASIFGLRDEELAALAHWAAGK
jgi:cytochrome c553